MAHPRVHLVVSRFRLQQMQGSLYQVVEDGRGALDEVVRDEDPALVVRMRCPPADAVNLRVEILRDLSGQFMRHLNVDTGTLLERALSLLGVGRVDGVVQARL